MALSIEEIASELFKEAERQKTSDCLGVDTLAEYIEHTLPSEEWDGVEKHLRSCLHCLNQLVELRELLFLEKKAEPLPNSLERKIRRLAAQETGTIRESWFAGFKGHALTILERTRAIFSSRYTWQAVSGLSLAFVLLIYLGISPRRQEDYGARVAAAVGDSIVAVRGMDANKTTVRQGAGVIVDPRGFVLLPLHLITDIASGEVTLTSGVRLPIKGLIGADPESDLAVVELNTPSTLKALKIAAPAAIQAGDRVVALSKADNLTPQVSDGVLGDIIPLSPRTRGGREIKSSNVARQFIPIGSGKRGIRQAILVDTQGDVVSVNTVSPEGEKIGLATPIVDIKSIIKSPQRPISLSQLKYKSHPPAAIFYYVKGILAYDSGNIDEAINYYKRCLEIDYSYDPAHVELGGMYYLKGDHDKESFHYKEAIKFNPANADAHSSLAGYYDDQGRYDLAVEEYERAVKLEPKDTDTRKTLAIDYRLIGRRDKALEQYEALKNINEGAANDLKRILDLAPAK